MEQFEIIEDEVVVGPPFTRQELLVANAFDLPILKLIMELLEKDIPGEVTYSEPRSPRVQLMTGKTSDYTYTIKRTKA